MERRKYKRVAVDAYVSATLTTTLTTDKTREERVFTTKDISPEGIFLTSSEPFPVGTILKLRIHTPTTLQPIDVEARVVRIATNENSSPIGMGLVFVQMDEEVKKELLKHLYLSYHYTEIAKKA